MAKGYWGRSWAGCMCSKSGPKAKFCCATCGHVCKAPHEGHPVCPGCRVPMVYMGDKWRPLKKRWRAKNALAAAAEEARQKKSREIWNPS